MSKSNFQSLFEQLTNQMSEEQKKLEREQQEWEKQKETMKKCEFEDIVYLNVGGSLFLTTLSTLRAEVPSISEDGEAEEKTDDHMLAIMFSGNFDVMRDENARVFIDRDGTHFRYILNYLRSGGDVDRACVPMEDPQIKRELREEAQFYGLMDLVQCLDGISKLDSTILTGNDKPLGTMLLGWIQMDCKDAHISNLLYRGSRDGFGAAAFHSKCDNRGATVTIIRSTQGCIFGGFSDISWTSSGGWTSSNKSWLFLLKRDGKQPQKLKLTGGSNQHAVHCNSGYGPTFGGGHDLYVSNTCNSSGSRSNLGHTYQNGGDTYLLTGNQDFVVQEIEVYSVANFH